MPDARERDHGPVEFQALDATLVEAVLRQRGGMAWHRDRAKWERYLREHEDGHRHTIVGAADGQAVVYGSLLFRSNHAPFRRARTPEIADLVVAELWRGHGLARRLIARLEDEAARRGHSCIGIGVGLYKDYGPAQYLYASLGFVMDGSGLTAGPRAEPVRPGSSVTVDDDLLIWMIKPILGQTFSA